MKTFTTYIHKLLTRLSSSLLPSVKNGWASFVKKGEGISTKDKITDLVSVLRRTWVFLIFVSITTLVFITLPQGTDILLIVVEDVGVNYHFANLFWLLVSVTFWAVLTEYGARYSIYVSDNSGRNFLEKRVQWRIAVQKVVAASFLVLPYLCILFSLGVLFLNNTSLAGKQKNIGFGITAFAIYWVFSIVSKPYIDIVHRRKKQERLDDRSLKNKWFWRLFLLPHKEHHYVEKLFGIYNNYVFALPKETWFKNEYRLGLNMFYQLFKRPGNKIIKSFPQNRNYLTTDEESSVNDGKVVDEQFILVYPGTGQSFDKAKNELLACEENKNGFYRWEYKVPNSFFKVLHRQLRILSFAGVIIIVIFSFAGWNGNGFYQWIGSPALVFFSFAGWSGIYIGLMFLDKAVFQKFPISIRFMLLLWLIICSLINNDHPVRTDGFVGTDNRPSLDSHFRKWIVNYKNDSNNIFYKVDTGNGSKPYFIRAIDSSAAKLQIKDTVYPVTFICAEGGALRTGCFAALTLANLQDTLRKLKYDFYKTVYALSGVSGGAVGLGYFNAVHYLNDKSELQASADTILATNFFSQDYLAPVLGKLLYGDVINQFIPFNWKIDHFDRAIALEESWEKGYNSVIKAHKTNVFSSNFRYLYSEKEYYPAFFINTTEVESGLQCWITNVRPNNLLLASQRDLLHRKVNRHINYSTAINFSSRFPLISPGAMVEAGGSRKYHYVDGGYVENTGAATMIEILRFISEDSIAFKDVMPCVLVIKFSDPSKQSFKNVDFANEISEIINGIYNTRSGRAAIAEAALEKLTEKELQGIYATFSLSQNNKQVPLNWVFSNQSINNINLDIKRQLRNKENPGNIMNKICFFK